MHHFVVLEHDYPELHWDFMLEHEGILKTWRLEQFPPFAGQKVTAQAIADHRLFYLNYEGPVSGNRGQVVRRDEGTYVLVSGSPLSDSANPFLSSRLLLSLDGARLRGLFALEHLEKDIWQWNWLNQDRTHNLR